MKRTVRQTANSSAVTERAQHQQDFQLAVVPPAAVGAGLPARLILRLLLYDHHLRIPDTRFLWSHCPGKQRTARCS